IRALGIDRGHSVARRQRDEFYWVQVRGGTDHKRIDVNRRPKLTLYRRPKLTRLSVLHIRFGWIGCGTAEQAARERTSDKAVASERRAESDQNGINRASVQEIELVGSPLVSFLRGSAMSAPLKLRSARFDRRPILTPLS